VWIGLALFGLVVTAIAVYFFLADSPISTPVVSAIWYLPPPYRSSAIFIVVVGMLIGL